MLLDLHFKSIDSTILYLKREKQKLIEAMRFASDIVAVSSDMQTDGIGRDYKKHFFSPNCGNVYISCIIPISKQKLKFIPVSMISQIFAYSILKVINDTGIKTQFKWPNDIINNHKKIAGIMSERFHDNSKMIFVSVSCGINVNMEKTLFSNIKSQKITSIFNETQKKQNIIQFRQKIISALQTIQNITADDMKIIKTEIENRLYLKNTNINLINDGIKIISGTLLGIDEYGRCIIKNHANNLSQSFTSGSIQKL